jgi:hypothetical protein
MKRGGAARFHLCFISKEAVIELLFKICSPNFQVPRALTQIHRIRKHELSVHGQFAIVGNRHNNESRY